MYAIKKFKDRGYTLKAQDNKMIFEDIAGCRYIFDLTNKKVSHFIRESILVVTNELNQVIDIIEIK